MIFAAWMVIAIIVLAVLPWAAMGTIRAIKANQPLRIEKRKKKP